MKELTFTGERMLPEVIHTTIIIEHLHRYGLATSFCKDKVVLDIASGEGYGSNLLSQYATHVTGVDIDKQAVHHATKKYQKNNLIFKTGSADKIPLEDSSVDVVVSFETIEHHDKHDEMMMEIKRVLKKGGILIMSTPDKKYYTDVPGHEGQNTFHVKELYAHEFDELLKKYFNHVKMLGQQCGTMSTIFPFKQEAINSMWLSKGDTNQLSFSDSLEAIFLIAIASDNEVNHYSPLSIFNDAKLTEAIYKRYMDPIYNSESYRLGNFLLTPFRWIRSLISGKRK